MRNLLPNELCLVSKPRKRRRKREGGDWRRGFQNNDLLLFETLSSFLGYNSKLQPAAEKYQSVLEELHEVEVQK